MNLAGTQHRDFAVTSDDLQSQIVALRQQMQSMEELLRKNLYLTECINRARTQPKLDRLKELLADGRTLTTNQVRDLLDVGSKDTALRYMRLIATEKNYVFDKGDQLKNLPASICFKDEQQFMALLQSRFDKVDGLFGRGFTVSLAAIHSACGVNYGLEMKSFIHQYLQYRNGKVRLTENGLEKVKVW